MSYRFITELNRSLCELFPSLQCCSLCDKLIKTTEFLVHMQIIHGELLQFSSRKVLNTAPKLECDECPKRFHCYSSLQRHMLMDHDTAMRGVCKNYSGGSKRMVCGFCGEYATNIIDHLLESHGKEIAVSFKHVVCPRCDDLFEQKNLTFEEHLMLNCKWAEPSDEEI